MNNIDRVAAEIRRRTEQESLVGISADELAAFLLEVVDAEDRHLLKKHHVQKEVENMVRSLANEISRERPSPAGDEEC